MNSEKIMIVYFSGTGGTKLIVDEFKKQFIYDNVDVNIQSLDLDKESSMIKESALEVNTVNCLLLLYPVHAFDAPQPVYDWIDALEEGKGQKVAVISVSGGGEMWPNTSCRIYAINELEKKGYNIFYENMLVMPSNILLATNLELCKWLIQSTPDKTKAIVETIIKGDRHRTKRKHGSVLIKLIADLEKRRAFEFGQGLKSGDQCDGCNWCVENCPRNNIVLRGGKPIFHNKCIVCMRCVYGCPINAITNERFNKFILENGFDIGTIVEETRGAKLVPVMKCTKGIIWLGVRKFLLNKNNGVKIK